MIAGAAFGASGVMLGAMGAHSLESLLTPAALDTWDTAVFYHLVHALALLLTVVLADRISHRAAMIAGLAFGAGIVLFSGSLYLLVMDGPRWLGPLTPLGGVAFIVGWASLGVGARGSPRT